MGLTGHFKVLYDIIQHELENWYFFFLLYFSHFVIPSKNTQKCIKYVSVYTRGHKKSLQHTLTKFANMTLNINICPCTIQTV